MPLLKKIKRTIWLVCSAAGAVLHIYRQILGQDIAAFSTGASRRVLEASDATHESCQSALIPRGTKPFVIVLQKAATSEKALANNLTVRINLPPRSSTCSSFVTSLRSKQAWKTDSKKKKKTRCYFSRHSTLRANCVISKPDVSAFQTVRFSHRHNKRTSSSCAGIQERADKNSVSKGKHKNVCNGFTNCPVRILLESASGPWTRKLCYFSHRLVDEYFIFPQVSPVNLAV